MKLLLVPHSSRGVSAFLCLLPALSHQKTIAEVLLEAGVDGVIGGKPLSLIWRNVSLEGKATTDFPFAQM